MPRPEYKTITVKKHAFRAFLKSCAAARKQDPKMDNTSYLMALLEQDKSGRAKGK